MFSFFLSFLLTSPTFPRPPPHLPLWSPSPRPRLLPSCPLLSLPLTRLTLRILLSRLFFRFQRSVLVFQVTCVGRVFRRHPLFLVPFFHMPQVPRTRASPPGFRDFHVVCIICRRSIRLLIDILPYLILPSLFEDVNQKSVGSPAYNIDNMEISESWRTRPRTGNLTHMKE